MCEKMVELFRKEFDAGVNATRKTRLQQGIECGILREIGKIKSALDIRFMRRSTYRERGFIHLRRSIGRSLSERYRKK